ncbi:MAG: glycoside hydrolase family 3 C-terminal domain-containing protein [Butyrivibrio sp.]|nr:glycoside hydrolase family 3 C-terminal domain-containing protein [Butyrivibrio sp.]
MYYKKDWKKYRAGFEAEAVRLLSDKTLPEKIGLMSGTLSLDDILGSIRKQFRTHYNSVPYVAGGLNDIPSLRFVDGTRGVVCGNDKYTCFPVAVMRGATFNTELEEEVGRAIGEEVIIAGGNLFGGICLNVPYHPGWGRSQEVYGEDTVHIAKMGKAIIEGVQSTGVIACLKHFAFNSMENIRREVDVNCNAKAEREIFLRQFEDAVNAGAGAVMTSYNSFRGVKCGQNKYLIKDTLIDKWKFDGLTMCDFTWGITDTVKAIKAGQNIEMPNTSFYGQRLLDAVKDGQVTEAEIDEAALRIVRTLIAHESVINDVKSDISDTNKVLEKHRMLSKKVAQEGITLLKNDNVLPLKYKDKKSKIVVLGELADSANIGDKGSSQVYPPYVITPLQGLINNCGNAEIIYYNGKNLNHCKRLAKDANAVVVVAGNDFGTEGEKISSDNDKDFGDTPGGDRCGNLRIQERDRLIIDAVSEIRGDTIVLLEGGSTIAVEDFIDKIGALLFCYYPGMEGGNAIAEVLFGEVNPSGKLPFVIPRSESDLQEIDWTNKSQYYDYFHGYTLLDKKGIEPLFNYGYGLSYTTFNAKLIEKDSSEVGIRCKVSIKNTGEMEGGEVVKIYLTCKDSSEDMPVRWLADFKKVFLKSGEEKEILFIIDISFYNIDAEKLDVLLEI